MKELAEMSSSDGKYTPSWIWRSGTTSVSREEVNEDMRVEWAQCMARADRWEEEVTLLKEEMRRVVHFLQWRSDDWLAKVDSRIGTAMPSVRSGLSAYAIKQAAVFHNLAVRFCQRWRLVLISLSLPHNWATKFLETHKEPLNNPDFKERKRKQDVTPLVARRCNKSSASVTAPARVSPLPHISETIIPEVHISDVDSDGTPSEDDESGYESTSSVSE
jgi:hypothetical protein